VVGRSGGIIVGYSTDPYPSTVSAKTQTSQSQVQRPAGDSEIVVMARIAIPFGIKGWVKLHVFTEEDDSLGAFDQWWVEEINPKLGWVLRKVEAFEVKPNGVLAKFAGCDDRNASEAWRGRSIAVLRGDLPTLDAGDAYQIDMIGYAVVNLQGESLGAISEFIETGANDVIVTQRVVGTTPHEHLIPAADTIVIKIDHDAKCVTVDWQLDY
jgi:16S rRNA processing protein RimM